ncbi:hypothetical protein [Nocardia rhizosphaerae]|uniref:Uncharacterized protein n=1 Tax=Nocardia rhizosphaerae TaxID=1691571 RepID=A0ABV8L1B7_9NOCA
MKEPEPMFDVARGDAAVSRQVGDALRAIARGSGDRALQEQIANILAGRGSVREFARGEAFNRVLDGVLPSAMAEYSALSDEERARLAEEGRLELERVRNQLEAEQAAAVASEPTTPPAPTAGRVIPGSRKPNRDRVVSPDEPDDEDLYFRERNQKGWLS